MTELTTIWAALSPIHELIYSIAITCCTALLLWFFRARVNLIWGSTSTNFHQFPIGEESNAVSVWTEKYYVQNIGKKPAKDIEIVFNVAPTSYNLWPPRDHAKALLENKSFVLKVPSLAPGELLILDMIDVHSSGSDVIAVNCPDAVSSTVGFAPTRQYPKWVHAVVMYLMISGFLGTVYFILKVLI